MGDRVSSDHDSLQSHRLTLASIGRTSRPKLALPDGFDVNADDVVRLTIDGEEYHTQLTKSLEGDLEIHGAFDNPRLARDASEGTDRLAEWVEATDQDIGRSVLLDVLVEGRHYGLRSPGERVVYTVREPPSDSLSDIASDLEK